MMALDLMLRLRAAGVSFWLEGEAVRFSGPSDVLSAELLQTLKSSKSAIRDILRGSLVDGRSQAPATRIKRSQREGEIPLSFAQQRLWFLDQLEPDSAFYNIPAAVRLSGPLQVGALEQSLQEVVRRHEALRTRFPSREGQARQEIGGEVGVSLPVMEVQEGEVLGRAEEEARKPFNLAEGPLLRAALLRLSAREHVLLVTMHHIVSDGGWSVAVLVREVGALYEAFSAGRPSPLPELPIQYADYAVWQRQWLSGDVLETQLAYWKKQLGGAPPALELPTDRPRPAVQTYRGAALPVALPLELSAQLTALSRREGVTLFMTLLAAFQVLLSRYTGQDDIVVGSPIAGRTQAQTEGLIGFFVNTLVLRTDLSGEPTARELLERVREVTLGAYAHQDVPFEKLVEELAPVRDPSRSPLFQASLVLQNAPMSALTLGEVKLRLLEVESTTAKFELTLTLQETDQGLRGTLEYNTDLFDVETVARMWSHYQVLLDGLVAEPGRRVSELPLLTEAERHEVVVAWNNTAAEYPRDRCIHELFEAQVERTPEAVALVFEEERLTYRELNERANQLAHHLRGLGVGPEVLVGLCVERSVRMVVGLLGILKAGGAYVPLDPSHPRERLGFMLEDTGAPVLLTQERWMAILPEHRSQVLFLDSGWDVVARQRVDNPVSGAGSRNLAYVIYTSGSTGKPKGVLVEHHGVCNLAQAQARGFGVQEGSRVLQFAGLGFDAAVSEVFMALTAGGTLWLASREALFPGQDLVDLMHEQAINVVTLPPTAVAVLPQEPLPELRCLVVAGEPCPPDLVARWGNGRRFINAYGPTEATVCATFHECEADGRSPPIGRPLANARVYVLDRHLRPVPTGVSGELYIGGAGVARGYLNRPKLTAERFVQDPFSGEPGARLYKTGDLCRFRSDGHLEYLGRIDQQVKIRGFRIELGEIESELGQHPANLEAVVLAREDAPGDKRLVAYLVAREAPVPPVSELRSYLQTKLPDYMVPAAFVELAALPLTPNGKVDRKALPAPERVHLDHQGGFVAPRTPVEEVVAGIWAEMLHLDRVSVFDNFFQLGGHSLLAVRTLSPLRQVFGIALPLRALMQAPTLEALALEVEAMLAGSGGDRLASVPDDEQGNDAGSLPVLPFQQVSWQTSGPDKEMFIRHSLVETTEPLDMQALRGAFRALLRHHDALRLCTIAEESGLRQLIAPPGDEEVVSCVDLSDVPGAERSAAIEAAAMQVASSIRLAEGSLVRACYFDLGPGEAGRLLLVVHHHAADAFSDPILVEDLLTAYQQLRRGEAAALPRKTTSFRRYAERMAEHALSEHARQEASYWLRNREHQVAPLPVDQPGDRNKASRRGQVTGTLGAQETSALLRRVSAAADVHIAGVLLTALVLTFEKRTECPALLVSMVGHGRDLPMKDVDLSRTVGDATCDYPLLLDVSGASGPLQALAAVGQELRSVPNGGVGYGILRYMGDPAIAAALGAQPQPEVFFNYAGHRATHPFPHGMFRPARECLRIERQPAVQPHLFWVESWVENDGDAERLNVTWSYCEQLHRHETARYLLHSYLDQIRRILDTLSPVIHAKHHVIPPCTA